MPSKVYIGNGKHLLVGWMDSHAYQNASYVIIWSWCCMRLPLYCRFDYIQCKTHSPKSRIAQTTFPSEINCNSRRKQSTLATPSHSFSILNGIEKKDIAHQSTATLTTAIPLSLFIVEFFYNQRHRTLFNDVTIVNLSRYEILIETG